MATDFLAILDKSNASKAISFEPGQLVFRQGQSVRWLYRITHGHIRLSRVLMRGSEVVLARVTSGEILAEASVFTVHYHCDAFAAQIMDLRAMIEIRAIRRADDRLLSWLRFRSHGDPPSVDGQGIWPSVAKQIGLSGESLYRALARLQRAGKIERPGTKVVLTVRPKNTS